MKRTISSVMGLLALASQATAQVASVCPSTGVCYGLNIPERTASSGSGDIFFQISAPSNYEWVALGQGSGMPNSNIFVVYTSGSGNNVTLSPRSTSSYQPPSPNDAAQVTLLEGSGVSNGVMTANVRCSNCNSWSGGTMDFTRNSGSWIFAYQSSGGPKNDDSTSAQIDQHSNQGVFDWQFAQAKGGSSVNPLVNTSPTGTTGGATPTNCRQRPSGAAASGNSKPSQTSSSNDDDDDDDNYGRPTSRPTSRPNGPPGDKRSPSPDKGGKDDDDDLPYCDTLPNGGATGGNSVQTISSGASVSPSKKRTMLIAHGVLASLAFVILFPSGAIAIRLASFPGIVWLHAGFQILAYMVYIAAFGMGIWLALPISGGHYISSYHAIIGILVFCLVFFMPFLGTLHHILFKKTQRRTLTSYAHIWVGRIAITLGMINGGLGLLLADNSRDGAIAYGVIAAVMWLVWVAAMVVGEARRKKAVRAKNAQRTDKVQEERRESDRSTEDVELAGHYRPAKGQQ
ncbi:hypothetical protein J4E86_001545 [Alternaria arbusti]|uniref:uncharacterized protein n=1 Tax=Alternaria arbusti TaxID=232088 RepID=UPI00222068B3|nr:uncharacterized protein J4E86_001545 [Alternaria arbusti]KAI4959927.1 hypothetical protein J4E86_001545 [Alternaria arbusti]